MSQVIRMQFRDLTVDLSARYAITLGSAVSPYTYSMSADVDGPDYTFSLTFPGVDAHSETGGSEIGGADAITTIVNYLATAVSDNLGTNNTLATKALDAIAYVERLTNVTDLLDSQLHIAAYYAQVEANTIKTSADAALIYETLNFPTIESLSANDIAANSTLSNAAATYSSGNVKVINVEALATVAE